MTSMAGFNLMKMKEQTLAGENNNNEEKTKKEEVSLSLKVMEGLLRATIRIYAVDSVFGEEYDDENENDDDTIRESIDSEYQEPVGPPPSILFLDDGEQICFNNKQL